MLLTGTDEARLLTADTVFAADGSKLAGHCAWAVASSTQLLGEARSDSSSHMSMELLALVEAGWLVHDCEGSVLVVTDCLSLLEVLSDERWSRLLNSKAVREQLVTERDLLMLVGLRDLERVTLGHVKAHDWLNELDEAAVLNYAADKHAKFLAHESRLLMHSV